jgi:CheY-like chemotaxis protein
MESSTQHPDHAPLVVAVLRDLFFGVKIAEAARRAGGKARFVTTEDDLLAAAASHPAMAVFDLQQRDLQPARLLRRLKQNPDTGGIPTLGYFSHVQEELRTEALEAGCDTVLPRSKFTERVDELVGDAVRRALQTPPHG